MKEIKLLLEDEEIFILRMIARMTATMNLNNEIIDSVNKKIIDATNDFVSEEQRKDIGEFQRGLKEIKNSDSYPMIESFINNFSELMLQKKQEQCELPTHKWRGLR